jgi:hypothetical protein
VALSVSSEGFAVVGGFTHLYRRGEKDRVHFVPHKLSEQAGHVSLLVPLDLAHTRFLVQRETGASFTPGRVQIWTPEDSSIAPLEGVTIFDAALSASGKLVVLALDGEGDADEDREVFLFEAKVEGTRLSLVRKIALPEPARIDTKSSLFGARLEARRFAEERRAQEIEDGDADEDDDTPLRPHAIALARGGRALHSFLLTSNPHGVALGSAFRGVVAVLDPTTLAPRFCARVPAEEEQFDVFALAAPGGVLVTSVANYRQSDVVFLDNDGAVKGNRSKTEGGEILGGIFHAGALLDDATALSGDGSMVLSLPSLKAKPTGHSGANGFAESLDGKVQLVSFGEHRSEKPERWTFVRFERGKKKSAEIDLAQVLTPPVPRVKPVPSSAVTGAARLGVAPSSAWSVGVGKDVDVPLTLTNLGGACDALRVVAGGPAFDQKLVALVTERIDQAVAPGIVTPEAKAPVEPSKMPITVTIKGLKAGSALLTLRLIPELKSKRAATGAPSTEGSALCGRPVTVV